MLKFLRKYNKWILAVGGCLLMVAFLLPQAIRQLGSNQGRSTYLRIDGRKVNGARAGLAFREYQALDTLPSGGTARGGLRVAVGIESPDHWLLLSDLAERSGYVGDQRDGEEFFGQAVRQLFVQMLYMTNRAYMLNNPQMGPVIDGIVSSAESNRAKIAESSGLTDEEFNMALAKFRGVMRMMESHNAASRFSRPRVADEAQRRFDEAGVDYVFISADSRLDEVPDPTDEEVAAHFQAYKDKRPGEGQYGFGYLLPARVKLEWLTLNHDEIAAGIDLDEVEVQARLLKYLDENPDADEEQAHQTISEQVRTEAVQEVMRLARQAIQLKVDESQRALPTNGEYLVLPADYAQTRPTLDQLADAVVQRVEQDPRVRVRMPRPTVERRDTWLTQSELAAIEGIGRSTFQRGTQAIPFPLLAMNVREIETDPIPGLGLQQGVLQARPLQDSAGNQYFFRILAARPESAPDSVADIRDAVATDLKRLRAYEGLKSERDALLAQAVALGLDVVAQSAAGGPDVGPATEEETVQVKSARVTRVGADAPELNAESFRQAVMDMAGKLDPSAPVDTVDALSRTLAMGIDESLGLAVARITSWQPLSLERFRTVERSVERQMAVENSQEREVAPFSYEALIERLNVEFAKDRRSDDDQADESEDAEDKAPDQA